jgi:uncharacterized membrane protein YeaQ/YmgE (transglycosylase-associated protein family)
MQAYSVLVWVAIGTIVGLLANTISKLKGVERLGNIVAGVSGAIIGGSSSLIFGIPVENTVRMSFLTALAGAVILNCVMPIFRRFL